MQLNNPLWRNTQTYTKILKNKIIAKIKREQEHFFMVNPLPAYGSTCKVKDHCKQGLDNNPVVYEKNNMLPKNVKTCQNNKKPICIFVLLQMCF